MEALFAAEAVVKDVIPNVVSRYRSHGILT